VAELEWEQECPIDGHIGPELGKLYILDWFSGMGIGAELVRLAEQEVVRRGHDKLWLWVYAVNDRAVSFYTSQGYEWIGNAFFQMEFNRYENKVMIKEL
jgi:ribosomal protein S18 acetylase RimI-like enzyme